MESSSLAVANSELDNKGIHEKSLYYWLLFYAETLSEYINFPNNVLLVLFSTTLEENL